MKLDRKKIKVEVVFIENKPMLFQSLFTAEHTGF